jgi:hypothetical protein
MLFNKISFLQFKRGFLKIKSNMFNGKHTVLAVRFAIAFLGASITASAATFISNLRVL